MIIGIDFDGVLFDTESFFRTYAEIFDIMHNGTGMVACDELRAEKSYAWGKDMFDEYIQGCLLESEKKAQIMPYAKEIIDMLRQRSRPYLFSNSVAPAIIGASLEMFKMLKESDALHTKLMDNVNYFRDKMLAAGFDIKPTQSAICAVMLYDAKLSQDFAAKMQEEGIYVTGFYYPVVPKGQARIRVQLSAGHEKEHLDKAIAAFIKVGKELGVIK